MELSTNHPRNDSRSRWIWAERALLAIGIVCLGIFVWSWLDAKLYEREQNKRLEQALARPAAETDSFESLQKGAERVQATQQTEEKEEEEKPPPPAPESGELVGRLAIPRLGVTALVLEGVEKKTLRRGAGHIPATALPDQEEGNVGIAAHRDSHFRALKDIQEDDTIELTTLDGTLRYQVEWTKIVKPNDVSVLEPTDEPALTLVTCYPFYYVGSAPQRFIVRAHLIPEIPEQETEEWLVDVDTE
jgi:sortase A